MFNDFGGSAPTSAGYLVLQLGEGGQEFAVGCREHAANPIGKWCIDEGVGSDDDMAHLEQSGDVEFHVLEIERYPRASAPHQLRQYRMEALQFVELLAK